MEKFLGSDSYETVEIYEFLKTKFKNLPTEGVTKLTLVIESKEIPYMYVKVMPTLHEEVKNADG